MQHKPESDWPSAFFEGLALMGRHSTLFDLDPGPDGSLPGPEQTLNLSTS